MQDEKMDRRCMNEYSVCVGGWLMDGEALGQIDG